MQQLQEWLWVQYRLLLPVLHTIDPTQGAVVDDLRTYNTILLVPLG